MAEINFLPVCSNCRAILDDREIDVKSVEERYSEYETLGLEGKPISLKDILMRQPMIQPYLCPNCGEIFMAITIPTRLPVEPTRKAVSITDV